MMEIILTILYWFLNTVILVAALTYAFKLWGKKNRLLIAISLFSGGIIWHVGRAIYTFKTDNCEAIQNNDGLLIIANKCIPSMAYDVIWAQIALFVGLFVILAELFKYFTKSEN